jgi:geranylgeranylglycerol-phosphate geranylgeranyltransferase
MAPLAVVELARPVNGLMSAAAVFVGAFVSTASVAWSAAALGAVSAFAAASGANALNDSLDWETDRINRPGRPVPSGRVSPTAALLVSVVAFAISVGLALVLSRAAAALAAGWLLLAVLYSVVLKGLPLVGNAAVAVVASTPFLMGGLSQTTFAPALIPASLAFLIHLAREIVKDVDDVEGDAASGVMTLAVRAGTGASLGIARGVLIALIVLSALPFVLGVYGWGYAVVIAVMDVALIRIVVRMNRDVRRAGLRSASNALKLVMTLGLLAFVAGRL